FKNREGKGCCQHHQKQQVWRPNDGSKSGEPVFHGLFHCDHQRRHRLPVCCRAYRSGGKEARRRREILRAIFVDKSSQPESLKHYEGDSMAKDLELTLMLADYHRTRPLLNGEVTAQGVKLQPRQAESGEACMRT